MEQVGNCIGGVAGAITMLPGILPIVGSQITAGICKEFNEDEDASILHAAWVYPLNALVSL